MTGQRVSSDRFRWVTAERRIRGGGGVPRTTTCIVFNKANAQSMYDEIVAKGKKRTE